MSLSPLSHESSYPSDFGLPRVASLDINQQQIPCVWRLGERVQSISFHPRFQSERSNLHLQTVKIFNDKGTTFQEPNSLLYDDHFYTQIHSLRSGVDHQYESLGTVWHNQDQGRLNNVCKKSVSLPVLDDYGGETEI